MQGVDAIRTALQSTQHLVNWFLSDLDDHDLLVRPIDAANNIAWQIGHLTVSETHMGKQMPEATYPELPAGFAEQHANPKGGESAPTTGYATRQTYTDLFNQVRQATLGAVAKLTDADLDRPTQGSMAKFAPTLGALLILVSNHSMMHGGQFSVVRRKLGKPILF